MNDLFRFVVEVLFFYILVHRFFKTLQKGQWYYEIQVVWFVFMWLHDTKHKPIKDRGLWVGRFHAWYDTAWASHGTAGHLRFFWIRLTSNTKQFRSPVVKLHVVQINAKHMLKRWFDQNRVAQFFISLDAYLRLYKAGFHITRSIDEFGLSEINRFWWKDKVIEDMADIDRVQDHYNTMFNGRSKRLGKSDLQERLEFIRANQAKEEKFKDNLSKSDLSTKSRAQLRG